jgi:hypothetical protein
MSTAGMPPDHNGAPEAEEAGAAALLKTFGQNFGCGFVAGAAVTVLLNPYDRRVRCV